MNFLITCALILILLAIMSYTIRTNKFHKNSNLLIRFKRRFRNKSRLREKLSEDFSNSLMSDPESNISIGIWYSENELREKANIHRARLSKYGKSKMNGEMLFMGPKGGVYKLTPEGKKKYV